MVAHSAPSVNGARARKALKVLRINQLFDAEQQKESLVAWPRHELIENSRRTFIDASTSFSLFLELV
jgi:hypothetical protein